MVRFLSAFLLALPLYALEHPCETEVSTACPDRAGSELASCLKNPEEHETVTTLSSECTDFVAVNAACADDIVKHCDDAFFAADTVLCLQTWTDPESLSEQCRDVMKWAVPQDEDDEFEDAPTDELGMSEKDHEEKQAWQAERRAKRERPNRKCLRNGSR